MLIILIANINHRLETSCWPTHLDSILTYLLSAYYVNIALCYACFHKIGDVRCTWRKSADVVQLHNSLENFGLRRWSQVNTFF